MQVIKGMGVVCGLAGGKVKLLEENLELFLADYKKASFQEEKEKIEKAFAAIQLTLNKNVTALKSKNMHEQAAIMEAHEMIASDPMLLDSVFSKLDETNSAPLATLKASQEIAAMFENMEETYFQERSVDVLDVGKRITKKILGIKDEEISGENLILCGYEIDPSVIANIPAENIAGVILGQGSTTCHAVIIAKARSIPAVVGIGKENIDKLIDEEEILLDGEKGEIIKNADENTIRSFNKRCDDQVKLYEYYESLKDLPAETLDNTKIVLAANISGQPSDMNNALKYGCEGVGLFRSEFLFMGRKKPPTEEEQFIAYKHAVEKCEGNLCVIRTMDIGGDKPLDYLAIPKEENPFLGQRAIRISLVRKDLFITQLKAILRAGVYGNAAIMLPMIVNAEEIKKAKEIIEEAKSELKTENKNYNENTTVGIMVETPAAAVAAGLLAKYVDFFSIGTNDLIQYTIAVDRVNPTISHLYSHYHPSVLRLIKTVIDAGKENNIWVGMCGEMASDPYAATMLLAMGMDELSMSAPSIPRVKEKIRSIKKSDAQNILAKVMELDDQKEIEKYIKENIDSFCS